MPTCLQKVSAFVRNQAEPMEVIVVDDGSADATAAIVEQWAQDYPFIRLIRNAHGGKGAAVRTGVAEGQGEYLFISDTDLAVPIEEILKFLPPQLEGYDLAVASREAKGSQRINEPFYRHLMGRVYNLVVQIVAVPGIQDTQCGFKCFSQEAARQIFPLQRRAVQVLGPVVQPLLNIPLPSEEVFDAVKQGLLRLQRLHDILADPTTASIRLVVNPEKMVIKEAQRTYTYLGLYGYVTDLVVCNRVFPDEISDGYFGAWREVQQKYLQLIEESFSPLPIRRIPMFNQEVVGPRMLDMVADALFGQDDPSAIFYRGTVQRIEKRDGSYVLAVPLPLAPKEAIDLTRLDDELIVRIGNQRRNLLLPRLLLESEVSEARLEGGELQVTFVAPTTNQPTGSQRDARDV